MEDVWGMWDVAPPFLISGLDGGEWSDFFPAPLPLGK
jgi:hypothetical protein